MSRAARWIDLGEVDAVSLHGACAGFAEAQAPDAAPLVVWAVCREPHLCLGASQGLGAEVDAAACATQGVPVLRRVLGGGTVYVDADQLCFFIILPRAHAPLRHAELFDRCLAPVASVYAAFGLPVVRVGTSDLWLDGRKLLGSGAATVGTTAVFGSSFLRDFPARRFADLMRAPSATYRAWLREELEAGMSCWRAHGAVPPAADIARSLQGAIAAAFDWTFSVAEPTPAERAAQRAAAAEAREDLEAGPALVENGIKVNHHAYLIESRDAGGVLRAVIRAGRIARFEAQPAAAGLADAVRGVEPELARLIAALDGLPDGAQWARRIADAAAGVRRVYG